MSRVPQPSTPRSSSKPSKSGSSSILLPSSRSRAASPLTPTPTPSRLRTKSTPKPPRNGKPPASRDNEPSPSKPPVSIREAIALKRAEAKKSATKSGLTGGGGGALEDFGSLEDALPATTKKSEDDDIMDLGRWSVKETIERARSTGTINISSRGLPCIPSALFEIHLGITPDPLKSVLKEPPISTGTENPATPQRRRASGGREAPSWFEAQDLQVLKAWSNEIIEIQPEISLFGSIKTLDLHSNKIVVLPDAIADLTALTLLDLSQNALESLPTNIFTLPNLTTLNISHNALTTLPFNAPFSSSSSNSNSRTNQITGSFFTPIITRATTPLPRLLTLNASHNKISAPSIHYREFPGTISKLDLSGNPLGAGEDECKALMQGLGRLQRLKELRLDGSDISDEVFPPDLFTLSSAPIFPTLRLLDLGETKVSSSVITLALSINNTTKREINFDITADDLLPTPNGGEDVLKVIVGKKVVKEVWEIELERRAKTGGRGVADATAGLEFGGVSITEIGQRSAVERAQAKEKRDTTAAVVANAKEPWEIEAEQGLLTEGGRRRARAAAAAQAESHRPPNSNESKVASPPKKESWEIEAEQGLLTEGGRRRARAAAAAAENKAEILSKEGQAPPPPSQSNPSSLTRYYAPNTQTLTLPPSSAPPKNMGHNRAFSLAGSTSFSPFEKDSGISDLALPTPTLPLSMIIAQPFAKNLRVLILANRRMDRSLMLPPLPLTFSEGYLPNLEELSFEGCGFGDTALVSRPSESGSGSPPRSNEPFIPLLTLLFPSLVTLDLSHNALTSSSLPSQTLSSFILSAPHRRGLKHLRLRGNRLSDLDGFQGLALLFKGNREVPEWKLEELDLRDNEIGKVPAELGLLPLDILLVDGNLFRIPQRRVWEREGTKGLLSWLRGRIE